MLEKKHLWYLLEILPLTKTWIGKNGQEVEGRRWNLASARSINHPIPHFHKSVEDRVEDGKKYDPLRNCRHRDAHKMVHEDDDLPDYVRRHLPERLSSTVLYIMNLVFGSFHAADDNIERDIDQTLT
ncbi:hypothetical protein FRC00_013390, partial [Tulasnella sp. 408]